MKEPKLQMNIFGVMRTYMPREDITTYELAKLHQLITVGAMASINAETLDEYVLHYGLERHFE